MTEAAKEKLARITKSHQSDHMDWIYKCLSDSQRIIVSRKLGNFIAAVPRQLSDHEKALLLYRVITKCVTYNHDETDKDLRYSYLGAMLTGSAVCQGICQMYMILCLHCDVPCNIITGQIKDSPKYHAWNQIWLRDRAGKLIPYQCDPTWDLGARRPSEFRYYLKNDAYMIQQNHEWDWDAESYTPCTASCSKLPDISEQLVDRMCREFKKMYSPLVCQTAI